jgi:hypothetical protein
MRLGVSPQKHNFSEGKHLIFLINFSLEILGILRQELLLRKTFKLHVNFHEATMCVFLIFYEE